MSTASTIIIKKPVTGYPNKFSHLKEYSTNLIAICLWGIAAIVTAANMSISPNATGISVSVKTQDVLLMLAMTYMLGKGLRESNYLLVIPWIVLSCWNMYHVHYTSLVEMGQVLRETRTIAKLPWIALCMDLLGLVMRLTLTVRIAHLAANQWCNRKLETQLKKKKIDKRY
ncbi:hypothetical protein QE152_g24554 [Popillia japonica]|uniref:Uncharacterized protein n=1 Tax=Popillia japonica TaxID=7064 RepID=A0AAW1KFG9_POPJA